MCQGRKVELMQKIVEVGLPDWIANRRESEDYEAREGTEEESPTWPIA